MRGIYPFLLTNLKLISPNTAQKIFKSLLFLILSFNWTEFNSNCGLNKTTMTKDPQNKEGKARAFKLCLISFCLVTHRYRFLLTGTGWRVRSLGATHKFARLLWLSFSSKRLNRLIGNAFVRWHKKKFVNRYSNKGVQSVNFGETDHMLTEYRCDQVQIVYNIPLICTK